jgi:hypothetical protein
MISKSKVPVRRVCSLLLWGIQLKLLNDNQHYDPSFSVDLPIAWGKLYCRREGKEV